MMDAVSQPDVVVVGAGAAGVAALRACNAAGLDAVAVEARSRAGGRAHTVTVGGFALDLGCGWLHSADRNPLVAVARTLCLTVDERLPPWQDPRAALSFEPGAHGAFRAAQAAFYARLEAASGEAGDRPAADFLEPGGRWNALIDAVSTYVNGVELDRLSVKDFANYHDTEVNFRVVEGYGALFARLAAHGRIAYGCVVSEINHGGRRVRVETSRGALEARAVIVALPTNVIAQGRVRFSPDLPAKRAACAGLPLGYANKLFLAVDGAEDLPENGRLFGATDRRDVGAFHFRPFGRPVIEGYFGGALARDLEQGGLEGFADFAIGELVRALGSAWRRRLKPLCASAWASDPFALGSYSHALPGCWDQRAILAEPVDGRIFFAGEATSPRDFSTAHGAWMSGERAAAEAVRALNGR